MITYHKEYGCWFQMTENSKHYELYEAITYKHKSTSDRVLIWDVDNDELVNFVYGANSLGVDELDKIVTEYVAEYEAKRNKPSKARAFIKHDFTKAGVKAFTENASKDFFAEMDIGGENLDQFDIVVSCGKHKIRVPLGAEEWDGIESWLNDAIEEWEG